MSAMNEDDAYRAWRRSVDAFWETCDDTDPDGAIERMRLLVDQRPIGDAEALFEWASIHDSVGRERDAVTGYRAALDAGLQRPYRAQALIQLASSLRNIGSIAEAIRLLESAEADESVGDSAQAFLALALHDSGRHADALRVALTALAPTLPQYRRSVLAYAEALERTRPPSESAPLPENWGIEGDPAQL